MYQEPLDLNDINQNLKESLELLINLHHDLERIAGPKVLKGIQNHIHECRILKDRVAEILTTPSHPLGPCSGLDQYERRELISWLKGFNDADDPISAVSYLNARKLLSLIQ